MGTHDVRLLLVNAPLAGIDGRQSQTRALDRLASNAAQPQIGKLVPQRLALQGLEYASECVDSWCVA
jgi:hypothetical protein